MAICYVQARLLGPQVDELKVTPTTVRMRLAGTASGTPVKFMVEVSGRSAPVEGSHARVTVVPPARYGIAPFAVAAYTHDMLAATKVAAIMSPNRNVPRDTYDLHELAACTPEQLLGDLFEREALQQWMGEVLSKAMNIGFDQARDELRPYIPPDLRASLTPDVWEDMTLGVAERLGQGLAGALHRRPE